jgi:hypothetical protein
MAPYTLVETHRHFRTTHCIRLQSCFCLFLDCSLHGLLSYTEDEDNSFLWNVDKFIQDYMEYNPEHITLHSHRCKNLKFKKFSFYDYQVWFPTCSLLFAPEDCCSTPIRNVGLHVVTSQTLINPLAITSDVHPVFHFKASSSEQRQQILLTTVPKRPGAGSHSWWKGKRYR